MSYDPNAGQGPATPDAGGLPPELMAILSAAGGGGAAPAGPGAGSGPGDQSQDAAPDQPQDAATGGDDQFLQCLQKMVDDGKRCIDLAPDEQTKQRVLKLLAAIQSELAADEKQKDDMLAGKASPSAMRSALSG